MRRLGVRCLSSRSLAITLRASAPRTTGSSVTGWSATFSRVLPLGDALGDALGMALKQVQTRRLRPAIILVSDGADNNAGSLTPAESLAVARQAGVAIHTLQFGSDPFAAGRATAIGSKSDDAELQPDLADLSRLTQGQHFAIGSADDATRVIRAIDQLEPTLANPAQNRQVRDWYWVLLVLAAVALAGARWLSLRHTA